MWERKLHRLFDLLNLTLQATNISIGVRRCLVHFHHTNVRINVILEHANNAVLTIMQKYTAAELKTFFIYKR